MSIPTLSQIAHGLSTGHFSSEEITCDLLADIVAKDKQYNSFITITKTLALVQARAADQRRSQGRAAPLTGVPIAHKDIFCTRGIRTSCASRMLDNFVPPYESTVSQRLLDAGSVCLGKTNLDEFAMGSSNETSYYGVVNNPWDLDAVPGGSSGGSTVAVAAGLVPGATGTDTGGSIRQPASFCGVTGIKPTYGRVSRFGIIAYASSLDQAGPIARTAEDVALMLNVMAGFDQQDSTSVDRAVDDYCAQLEQTAKRVKDWSTKRIFWPRSG